ncbi:MAG: hypothetical protein KDB32_09595 [Planctomycetes bacterium]|nr:hypothetical protein [Planctomycetota bacterium]MCA8946881.1 hypothetical protein [Planctomycetota bacterium]
MRDDTQNSLEASKAFLRDCVEAAHLVLKRKIEALQAGEDVVWEDLQQVMREGGKATRQLAQIASLETRERAQTLREQAKAPHKAPTPTEQQPRELSVRKYVMQFSNGMHEWAVACDETPDGKVPPIPEKLLELMDLFGIDPTQSGCVEALHETLETRLQKELAA